MNRPITRVAPTRTTLTALTAALMLAALGACASSDSAPTKAAAASETKAATETKAHTPPTTAQLEPYSCGTVQRMHTLDGVFLASQPAAADFEQASKGGIKTVINNRHASETPDFDEKAIVEGLGMTYISLPYNGEAELTDDVFTRARELLASAQRPILMHCGSANRTGALWLAYRALDGGLSLDAARAEAKVVGLKSPAYEAKAVDYVKRKGGK